jgi:MYXO-CTERM domain-containing protein
MSAAVVACGRHFLVVSVALAFAAIPAPEARACGGFFCNQPQFPTDPPPIAQTGENVLFAMDKLPNGQNQLEAHIQIFYTGPADRFSWILPVDGLPVLDVGLDSIFTILERNTRPRFVLNLQTEGVCKDQMNGFLTGSLDGARSSGAAGQTPENGGRAVNVAFRGSVGPFDAAVLRADQAADLKAWLADNMYFVSDQADKLIDEYVREQKFFVALKLLSGKGVNEIRPIVLRFEGPGPCVPLRLTAIAATEDLGVNLWVLGPSRIIPENYYEIKLNLAKIDWLTGGQNYPDLLKQAANEAGGNAFFVEYAGPTTILQNLFVPANGYPLDSLRALPSPPDFVERVMRSGLPLDGSLLALLEKHMPLPGPLKEQGLDLASYFNRFRMYWQTYRQSYPPFDPAAVVAEIVKSIVEPLQKAQIMFDRYPKLTRLATFISPIEMNVDPTFAENPTLPDIARERTADGFFACGTRAHNRCEAPLRIVLPDGRHLWFKAPAAGWCGDPTTTTYERSAVDRMPALETAWQRDPIGEGVIRVDRRLQIGDGIEAQNASVLGCSCAIGGRSGAAPVTAVLAACGLAGLVVRRRRRRS